jgi:hypothetical protein
MLPTPVSRCAEYIRDLAGGAALIPAAGLLALRELSKLVGTVDLSLYESSGGPPGFISHLVMRRTDHRHFSSARCPTWTEDQDFFGSGVATWTTDRIELYLRGD